VIPNTAGHRMNTKRNLSFSVSSPPGALFLFLPAGEGWVVFPTSLGWRGGITMLVGSELSASDTDTEGGSSGELEGWEVVVARPA